MQRTLVPLTFTASCPFRPIWPINNRTEHRDEAARPSTIWRNACKLLGLVSYLPLSQPKRSFVWRRICAKSVELALADAPDVCWLH